MDLVNYFKYKFLFIICYSFYSNFQIQISITDKVTYILLFKGCIQQTTDVNTLTNQNPTTTSTVGATVATTTITITTANESTMPINQATKSTTTNMTATTTSDERRLMRRAKTAHSRPQADHNQYTHAISMSSRDVRRRPETNETVFKVNKGVKVFDFSFEKNLLVTGG